MGFFLFKKLEENTHERMDDHELCCLGVQFVSDCSCLQSYKVSDAALGVFIITEMDYF